MSQNVDGSNFSAGDGAKANQVPAGTTVYNPGTGQTGNADGYGGVWIK